jgi:hypothetical protein
MFDFDSSPEDQAHALRPIHSALEVLCMCEKYLKLPAHRLTTLSRYQFLIISHNYSHILAGDICKFKLSSIKFAYGGGIGELFGTHPDCELYVLEKFFTHSIDNRIRKIAKISNFVSTCD